MPRDMKNMTLRIDEGLAANIQAVAEVEGRSVTDVIRTALGEHVANRKEDPEFQRLLQRNIERHACLLGMLADG